MKTMLKVLAGEPATTPPVWLMRQAGRYLPEYMALRREEPDFIRFCLNSDMTTEATLQPIRRYGFDASILFADILLLPHAAGQRVWFEKDHGPRLAQFDNPADLAGLDWANAAAALEPVYETVSRLSRALPQSTTLIGFAGAPWTVATYMVAGGKDALRWRARTLAWQEPKVMGAILDRLVEASVDYLLRQIKAGAEVIKLFDSWAEALPQPLFDDVIIRPTGEIVKALKAEAPHVPIIGFPRGSAALAGRYAEKTGVDALALDMSQAEPVLVSTLPGGLPLQGGLDPAVLTAGGEGLKSEVSRLVDMMEGRPYIFNLGHGISKDTPPEHVDRMLEYLRREKQA
jgi:uroporphyrinogen decarboxylase